MDPRTKLLLMAVVSTAEFLYSHASFMIAVAFIPTFLLISNKQIKMGISFLVLFSIALATKEIQGMIHLNIVLNMIVVFLVGVVLRLFPTFAMGSYIIRSTKASEFISAMGHMHISRKISIPVSVLFRFLPTMKEESAAIKDAMRMREIQFGTKKFWQNPAALVEYRFIPMMISVVKIGDELSAAALTRGLDNPVARTNITKIGFTYYDVITLVVSAVLLATTFFMI
ncbi:energy-coupling factor transporter transmembrane component T [Tissierella praeacuta]|uniref:energy-coupling factor transporter transmembrane component T n=1 Tax=Tissierella praeacuta TaxID=43131 RepID=UPI0033411CAA